MSYLNRFGSAVQAPMTPYGALRKTDGVTHALTAGTDIATYSVSQFDPLGWHSLADNRTLVAPSNANVQLVRFFASYITNTISTQLLLKFDGSAYNGFAGGVFLVGLSTGSTNASGMSAIIPVTAGDKFRMRTNDSVNQVAQANSNCFGVEVLPPGTRYTHAVRNATTQSIASGTLTSIQFNGTDVADTLNTHDPATNNHRFTIPAGTTGKVRVNAQTISNTPYTGGEGQLYVYLNGAAICSSDTKGTVLLNTYLRVASRIIDVVAGDVIEIKVLTGAATALGGGTHETWASIEEIPANHRYCIAAKSANQNVGNAAVQWDGADLYDPEGLHNPASNNTRINVPADATEFKLSWFITTGIGGELWTHSQALHAGNPSYESATNSGENHASMGMWVPVSLLAGQGYVECTAFAVVGSMNVQSGSYFQAEFR